MTRSQGTLTYDPPHRLARSLRGYRRDVMVFIFTGSGKRTAESFDGTFALASGRSPSMRSSGRVSRRSLTAWVEMGHLSRGNTIPSGSLARATT